MIDAKPVLAPLPQAPKEDKTSIGAGLVTLGVIAAVIVFMRQPRERLIVGWALVHGLSTLSLAGYVLIAKWRGFVIERVGVGMGATLFDFRVRDMPFRIHALPMGGYVKFPMLKDEETGSIRPIPAGLRGFEEGRLWERLLLQSSACLLLFVLAVVLRGPVAAYHSFVNGFVQIFRMLLEPRAVGVPLVKGYLKVVEDHRWHLAISIVATKVAAGNIFPFYSSTGATILDAFARKLPFQALVRKVKGALFGLWITLWIAGVVSLMILLTTLLFFRT